VSSNIGKNVIAIPYTIGQRVRIDAIDTAGVVKRVTMSSGSTEFQVRYFDDDKVSREEWLEPSEMSKA